MGKVGGEGAKPVLLEELGERGRASCTSGEEERRMEEIFSVPYATLGAKWNNNDDDDLSNNVRP